MDTKETERFDERTRILEMVAEGRLKANEASRLLEALQASDSAAAEAHSGTARWLKIRVYQMDTGKAKVSVNLPLALADVAMRFIPSETFSGAGVDPRSIISALRNAGPGKIIEAIDEEERQRVEITIE